MNIAEQLDNIIKITVINALTQNKNVNLPNDIIETDSLAEVIEKLVILHCRMWYLEDSISSSENSDEIAELKKKIDICFKIKRPKYVSAINQMIDNSIIYGKSLKEDSVKLYKGFK